MIVLCEKSAFQIQKYGDKNSCLNFRLYVGMELGFGEVIGYQCIGTEEIQMGQPDIMGQLVRFKVRKYIKFKT